MPEQDQSSGVGLTEDAPPDHPPQGASSGETTADISLDVARARVRKAPNAFRTISEVADDLHIPQHVLRFWETRFPQVKPMKRGGGRRYYRPDDISLLRRISDLLYIQGYTIKGVQRLLRDGGGRLSDDIPPAPEDERAAAAAEAASREVEQPSLMIPGFDLPARTDVVATPPAPRPVPVAKRMDPEARRLRAVLLEALSELEAIRALLG